MSKVQVLDCTLRDGGYVNNWEFSDAYTLKIIKNLLLAKVEIIECGFLDKEQGVDKDCTRFKTYDYLEKLVRPLQLVEGQQLVAMIEHGKYDLASLPEVTTTTKVTGIRYSFRKSDYHQAFVVMKQLKEKGYTLFVQPISTESYSQEELKEVVELTNSLSAYAIYIVDTQGSLFDDKLEKINSYLLRNLNQEIKVGLHSHNNMQLSYALAIEFIRINHERKIIIDSSIYGMGRGAGNLNTELITDYLNKRYNKCYENDYLLELIDSYFLAVFNSKKWGYSLVHFLSASLCCHPNYASWLLQKKRLDIKDIKVILSDLQTKEKYEFDKELIEKLYISYNSNKVVNINEPQIAMDKSVLILGPGKSSFGKLSTINRSEYTVIALNHKPESLEADYYFFNSSKRYNQFKDFVAKYNTIVISNLEANAQYAISYSELTKLPTGERNDNSLIIILNLLVKQGFTQVNLLGIDGFSSDLDNYTYTQTDQVLDAKKIEELNTSIKGALTSLANQITLNFLAESPLKPATKPKVVGVIPARYASTRLPGKPLADICGLPMVIHTMKRAMLCQELDQVLVATDDQRIFALVEQHGGNAVMTNESHHNGTERLLEVMQKVEGDIFAVINGDEALIKPEHIGAGVSALMNGKYNSSILYNKFNKRKSEADFKIVKNLDDEVMYISRSDIPNDSRSEVSYFLKAYHVMSYNRKALEIYSQLEQTIYDKAESHEMLRLLENKEKIIAVEVDSTAISVDTPEDLEIVRELMKSDELFARYK